jgi:asparagine synthase (glutamine-hydrolysing)
MPGVVGLITKKPRPDAEQELRRMLAAICHESSYETGTWIDEAAGIYIGWTARKNTLSSGMPVVNERGDLVLVFSGEEYTERETIENLKNRGHVFASSDSSYLVHFAEEDGNFPRGLNGRFHGVLVNRSELKATIFNDRYGIHRFYYHESKETFYFAAEAKAILSVRPELRTADPRGLGEFVSCGCTLENRTIFSGIHVLPPASAWITCQGSIASKDNYFQPKEWESQEPLRGDDYYQQLRSTFSRILPRYFGGEEKIGMSLTGGLDTRMIMAWQKEPAGAMPCYSFGGMFRECEDVRLARKVAEKCNQPFEVIPVDKKFLSRFSQYAERAIYLTDGCVYVNRASDLYANEIAAHIAQVRMTGNYGSEILRHLRAFKARKPTTNLFSSEFLGEVQRAQNTFAEQMKGHALSFIAFGQTPWHHHGLLALEETQLTLRSPYLDNDLVKTAFRAPDSSEFKADIFASGEDCVRLIGDGDARLLEIRTDRGFAGNSGAAAKALARQWLEFTFRAEYAYDYGMPQWVCGVDQRLSWLHLERLFLGRHKFNHYRLWYRDYLAEYVREMLLDERTLSRPYLNRAGVEAIVHGHLNGGRNYTTEIHQLLTLELIHRLYVDSFVNSSVSKG